MPIAVVTTKADLRRQVALWRSQGQTVALVPTMGALHRGHLSLVALGRVRCDRTVASIFVNPLQFAPAEDFARYPRPLEADLAQLTEADCDLAYVPTVDEMYADPDAAGPTLTTVNIRDLTASMEGAARPTHFAGVATVVTKLLLQGLPDIAIFGEKDYQQLQVVKRLVRDLDIPVNIVGAPTVREADGLALSSRNVYLSEAERRVASRLYATLTEVARRVAEAKAPAKSAVAWGREQLAAAGLERIDYLDLRDAETLREIDELARPARLLAAIGLGKVRLIDNVAVPATSGAR